MMNQPSLIHWLWLLPLGFLSVYLGSARFLGTQASQRLRNLLRAGLEPRRFTQLHDLHLFVSGRVEHYDHLVLSRSGIHVIDALHLPGDLKGTRVQAWWLSRHWGRKSRIANPVHENALRLEALQHALGLPATRFLPVVALSGNRSLDTDARDVVVAASQVVGKINSQARLVLSDEDVDAALLRIQGLQVKAPLLTARRRWRVLQLLAGLGFIAGIWLVYEAEIRQLHATVARSSEPAPTATSDPQRWEATLACSYSIDTGRCACYQPDGKKAEISPERCKSLAERGSVLKQ